MSLLDELESDSITICKICCKIRSRYTCPKCGILYCSVDCYKSNAHSSCSESFYKDCFMTELGQMKAGGEDKNKMLEMLQKLELDDAKPDAEEHPEEIDIHERFHNFNIDEATVSEIVSRLTEDEIEEFHKHLESGLALENLPPLRPWWCKKVKVSIDTSSSSSMPPKMKDIKSLANLFQGTVSPNIFYHIANVLFSYCYLYRLHNGLLNDLPLIFSNDIIRLSMTNTQASFTSIEMSISDILYKLNNQCSDLFESQEFALIVLNDVVDLLMLNRVEPCSSNALSHVRRTFKSAKLCQDYCELKDPAKLTIKRAQKKLEFYISWIEENPECMYSLIPQLQFMLGYSICAVVILYVI